MPMETVGTSTASETGMNRPARIGLPYRQGTRHYSPYVSCSTIQSIAGRAATPRQEGMYHANCIRTENAP